MAEYSTASLGHGGVATYPDRPFLHWRVTFDENRPGNGKVDDRDNPQNYLEACEKMHMYFVQFASGYYATAKHVEFSEIGPEIEKIIRFEGDKESRSNAWKEVIKNDIIYESENGEADIEYNHETWEADKLNFYNLDASEIGISSHSYKFHQAAALHRQFVLKELLPAHNIAVY